MYLTDLHKALTAYGQPCTTEPGWDRRGLGQMSSVKTITCHHTAGGNDAGDLRIVRDGRSDLRGPLAQILLRRNGVPHIIAAGQAAHAGTSRSETYRNPYAIGIEAVHPGTGSWSTVQYDGFARTCALLALYYKVPVSRVLGHKETCSPVGRKVDPNFDMAKFRTRVQQFVSQFQSTGGGNTGGGNTGGNTGGNNGGGTTGGNRDPFPKDPTDNSTKPEDGLMALSREDKIDVFNAVWFGVDGNQHIPNTTTGGSESPATALANIQNRMLRESGLFELIERQTAALVRLNETMEVVSNRMVQIHQIVSDPN